jgi:negative regulator of sigma E activity
MNEHNDVRSDTDFERRLRATFDESLDGLDASTLSRLNRSRQQAVEAAQRRGLRLSRRGWATWAPLGALAASVLVAVVVWRIPRESQAPAVAQVETAPAAQAVDSAQEPLELLTSSEDLALAAAADLDFYAWVELTTADAADGVG